MGKWELHTSLILRCLRFDKTSDKQNVYQDGRVLGVGSLHNVLHPRNAFVKMGYVSQAGVSDPELWFIDQNCGSLSLTLRWTASLLHDLWVTLRV